MEVTSFDFNLISFFWDKRLPVVSTSFPLSIEEGTPTAVLSNGGLKNREKRKKRKCKTRYKAEITDIHT